MQRQTRRLTTTAESAGVSQMDPWKDDRCRDFVALNTIQRLRAYHAGGPLPVDPVNVLRATNLLLLPTAEPDRRTCDDAEGCAVDAARILFFGPTAFVSFTGDGRMTASPHSRHHSGGRTSSTPALPTITTATIAATTRGVLRGGQGEEQTPTVSVKSTPQISLDSIHHKETNTEKDTAITQGSPSHDRNTGELCGGLQGDEAMPDATPLKRPEMDTVATPAPRLPDFMSQRAMTATLYEEEHEQEKGDVTQPMISGGSDTNVPTATNTNTNTDRNINNDNNSENEVVRFSCAIVEVIVAYYQSLLSRGVVLDRFSTRDLSFSWWVIGLNMDVAALHGHAGSMRRDALIIRLRNFYYGLLEGKRPKKSVFLDPPTSPRGVKEEGSTTKPEEEHVQDKPTHNQREEEEEEEQDEIAARDKVKTRTRSRLDPTRTSPPPVSNRVRRRVISAADDETDETSNDKQNVANTARMTAPIFSSIRTREQQQGTQQHVRRTQKPKETALVAKGVVTREGLSSTTTTTMAATTTATMSNNNNNNNNNNNSSNTTTGDATIIDTTTDTTEGAETTSNEHKILSSTTVGVDSVPPVEKSHRSTRSAMIEEVWRPIRSTRRRFLSSEDSSDFIEAKATTTDGRSGPLLSLKLVIERIERRIANDPIYATLLTAFPRARTTMKRAKHNHTNSDIGNEERGGTIHGMHPALVQLYRYEHVESDTTVTMLTQRLRGKHRDEVEEGRREVRNQISGGKKRNREHTDEEEEEEEVEKEAHEHRGNEGKEEKGELNEVETRGGNSHNVHPSLQGVVKTERDDETEKMSPSVLPNINHVSCVNREGADFSSLRIPSSFAALTYAQRCLLAWETSLMLFPPSSERSRKRQATVDIVKSEVIKPRIRQQRRFYDYWRNP